MISKYNPSNCNWQSYLCINRYVARNNKKRYTENYVIMRCGFSMVARYMGKKVIIACFFLNAVLLSQGIFSQEGTGENGEQVTAEVPEANHQDTDPAETSSRENDSQSTGLKPSAEPLTKEIIKPERGSPPEMLRRPERSESPRFPQDIVIGELGPGKAPAKAYRFALDLLKALAAGDKTSKVITDIKKTSGSALTETLLEEIGSLKPRSYRIGGGRSEPDGSVSFLVRFLSSSESITGELFLRQREQDKLNEKISGQGTEEEWLLDDLTLDEKRNLSEIRDGYRYDFAPYERFF